MNLLYKFGYCLTLSMLFFLASCKKEQLNRNPLTQPSSGTFWKTEDDIKLALAGCYNTLIRGNEGFGHLTAYWDGISDNAWPRSNSFNTISLGQIESTTGGVVSDVYTLDYRSIGTCNYFLANVGNVPINKAKIDAYSAEVRFLRAWYFFQLSEVYGGVPITTKPETYGNPKRAQSSKEEVVKLIMDDLDFAISTLADVSYTGRIVKGTALGLKAKVFAFNNRWQEAAATAKLVIDAAKFSLSPSYYGLFVKPMQVGNPEIMFSIKYQLPNLFHTLDYMLGWDQWEQLQPTQNLVDAYQMTDGKSITESPLYNSSNPYINRDPRLKLTVYVPGDPWKYSANGLFNPLIDGNNKTGFNLKKLLDTTKAPTGYATLSDQDIVLLRYADILLLYAEAQNEVAGPDQTVYNAVNAVRARPGINMPPVASGLTKDQLRQKIRDERRVELAFEGGRYFDLKRWKISETVIPKIINPGGVARKFDPKHYLWPFPQSEIDINPDLKQNTGY